MPVQLAAPRSGERIVQLANKRLATPVPAPDVLMQALNGRQRSAHEWAQTLLNKCQGNETQAAKEFADAIQSRALRPVPATSSGVPYAVGEDRIHD
jgi:hypothetical protein